MNLFWLMTFYDCGRIIYLQCSHFWHFGGMSQGVGHIGNGNIRCVYHVICVHVNRVDMCPFWWGRRGCIRFYCLWQWKERTKKVTFSGAFTDRFVTAKGKLGSPEGCAKNKIWPYSNWSSAWHVSFFYHDTHSWPTLTASGHGGIKSYLRK